MNSKVDTAINIAASIVFFVAAATLSAVFLFQQQDVLNAHQKAAEQEERRLFTGLEIIGEKTYTGAEVIQSIFHIHELDADIMVDGITFPKTLDIETVNVSLIDPHRKYIVSYQRDGTGKIQTIVFR
ncbi:hypothetical protein [Bacillus sp. FSL K6-6540]|uniref:hypothetical protein n=1 Tax=Bacillus sp. FSL K6-6540 TaxID=2921512 RepID=UPI0030FBF23A